MPLKMEPNELEIIDKLVFTYKFIYIYSSHASYSYLPQHFKYLKSVKYFLKEFSYIFEPNRLSNTPASSLYTVTQPHCCSRALVQFGLAFTYLSYNAMESIVDKVT